MTLPIYLAMTREELRACTCLPAHRAYMACHYAPYGTGLADLPEHMSSGELLIFNDRIPPAGHDPQQIADQLMCYLDEMKPSGLLLDLQRPGLMTNQALVESVTKNISVPVCVSAVYAQSLSCPVFVDMPPPHMSLKAQLSNWQEREIWLDLDCQAYDYWIQSDGCTQTIAPSPTNQLEEYDKKLCCHYKVRKEKNAAVFTLQRTQDDLLQILAQAATMDVTKAVGLYQQLHDKAKLFSSEVTL